MSDREQQPLTEETLDLLSDDVTSDTLQESEFPSDSGDEFTLSEELAEGVMATGDESLLLTEESAFGGDDLPEATPAFAGPPAAEDTFSSEAAPSPEDDLQLAAEEEMSDESEPMAIGDVRKTKRGVSPVLMGFFFFLLMLVGGLGTGYALLYVLGESPQQLLKLQPPLLYVAAGTLGALLFLGLLGAMAVGRASAASVRQAEENDKLLQKISQLHIKDMDGWQDEEFSTQPDLANNLLTMKYTYERLMSKHTRSVGLEGELLRLEKALVNGERVDLTSKFDHPSAGRLADEMLRLFDERTQARTQFEELHGKLNGTGVPLCEGVQDATRWNDATCRQIHSHAQYVIALRQGFEVMAQTIQQGQANSQSDQGLTTELQKIQDNLSGSVVTDASHSLSAVTKNLRDLVEREGKLAFQIAMVVARLGRDGEPLLPLTQKLEGMTNDFKQLAEQVEEVSGKQDGGASAVHTVCKQIQEIQGRAGVNAKANEAWQQIMAQAKGLYGQVGKVLVGLGELPPRYAEQSDRLNELGKACAELTGASYQSVEPGKDDLPIPDIDLDVERFDPFSGKGQNATEAGEPLAGMPAVPGSENGFKTKPAPEPVAPAAEPLFDQQVASPLTDTADDKQATLPETDDKVYDLNEFAAVPVDQEVADADGEDRIYELEEFGAVALS